MDQFKCAKCGLIYSRKDRLNSHVKIKHSENPPEFRCNQCDAVFTRRFVLNRHLKKVHNPDRKQPTPKRTAALDGDGETSVVPPKKKRMLTYVNDKENLPTAESPLHPPADQLLQYNYPNGSLQHIAEHWEFVRTKYRTTKLKNLYQFCLTSMTLDLVNKLRDLLIKVHADQSSVYKLQFGFTVLLHKLTTGEYRVFWAMNPSRQFYPTPLLISSKDDLEAQLERLDGEDLLTHMIQDRPDTSWNLVGVLSVSVVTFKLSDNYPLLGSVSHNCAAPPFVKHHPYVKWLDTPRDTNNPNGDQLCVWRAVVYFLERQNGNPTPRCVRNAAKELSEKYRQHVNLSREEYNGAISLNSMFQVEIFIKARIFIYTLSPKENCGDLNETTTAWKHFNGELVYQSALKRKDAKHSDMYFLLCESQHILPITNIKNFTKTYICKTCHKIFNTREKLTRHQKTCVHTKKDKAVYTGGNYHEIPSLWDKLEENGIKLDPDARFTLWYGCWDTECLLLKLKPNDPRQVKGDKLTYNAVCDFVSAAVNSNLDPHYTEAKFFCRDRKLSPSEVFSGIMDYFFVMSEEFNKRQTERYQYVFEQLDTKANEYKQKLACETNADARFFLHSEIKTIETLHRNLESHCKKFTLFTFNGARFDNKLVRDLLIQELFDRGETNPCCIKRNNAYTLLASEKLVFRDFAQLLPPGSSLDSFYKSQKLPVSKGHLPYDWYDNIEKLYVTKFPQREAFYNTLTNKELSEQDYIEAKTVFNAQCKNMRDYLEIYNKKDVYSFVLGIENLRQLYKKLGLCLINDGISLSALAYKFLHRSANPKNSILWLPRRQEKFVYDMIEKTLTGGPSIVFTRYAMRNETIIRDGPHVCKSVVGEDCNSLYLWAIGQQMPTGIPVNWKYDEDRNVFVRKQLLPKNVSNGECEYALWMQEKLGCKCCKHYLNGGGQKTIGKRKLRPDFLCTSNKIIALYNGCYIHQHGCYLSSGRIVDNEMTQRTKQQQHEEAVSYYESLGFKVYTKWECQWIQERRDPAIRNYLDERLSMSFSRKPYMTQTELLKHIKNGHLFGIITADVSVKQQNHNDFAEFPPFFVHKHISREHLCPEMLKRAQQLDLMKRPVKCLVSVMKQQQMTMITPLAKWYLNHGISFENVTEFIQYNPKTIFQGFQEIVTANRKAADDDKSLELIGTLYKNIGNAAYGKTMERKDRFTQTKFCDLATTSALVNRAEFMGAEDIGEKEQTWEVTLQKRRYYETNCKALASFILGYGKLRMLEYYYDFMVKYFPKNTWELLETDTDSLYMAIAAETREDLFGLVYKNLKTEFEREKHKFSATEETKRVPGLFKQEWHGDGMICLSPKCYVCIKKGENGIVDASAEKISAKGVSRRTNNLQVSHYLACLKGEEIPTAVNKGFMFKAPFLYKYTLEKRAMVDFYYKRLLSDNTMYKTMPLDM